MTITTVQNKLCMEILAKRIFLIIEIEVEFGVDEADNEMVFKPFKELVTLLRKGIGSDWMHIRDVGVFNGGTESGKKGQCF